MENQSVTIDEPQHLHLSSMDSFTPFSKTDTMLSIESRPTMLKEQVKDMRIKLNPLNTCFPALSSQKFNHFITITMICAIIFWFIDKSLNDRYLHLISIKIVTRICFLISFSGYTLKCNKYMFKQALGSFVVWYKTIHSLIAIIARTVYYNFEINSIKTIDTLNNPKIERATWIFNGILMIINVTWGIFALGISDGVPTIDDVSNGVYGIANKWKRFAMIGCLAVLFWWWIEIYYNIYNYNEYKSITINGIDYYWRSIVLSSIARIIAFTCAQLYHNLKRPTKLNVVPLSIKIHPVTLVDQQIMQDFDNIRRDSRRYSRNSKSRNSTISIGNDSNSWRKNSKNFKNSKSSKNAKNAKNAKNLQNESSAAKENSKDEIEIVGVMDAISEMHTRHDVDSIVTRERAGTQIVETQDHRFIIEMPIEMTVFYILLTKVFKFGHLESSYYSALLVSNIVITICGIFVFMFFLINAFFVQYLPSTLVVILHLCNLVVWLIIGLNSNYTLLYFKKRSFVLWWKLYNTVSFTIALYYLRYKFKRSQFDNRRYGFGESMTIVIVSVIYYTLATLFISLHQGYNIVKYAKWLMIATSIIILVAFVIYHYIDQDYDWQTSILGQNISMRNVIISQGFDLALWFSYQLYHACKDPMRINLVSKVVIKWEC